ncbi:MAG TPA: LptF/LptG family permease [Planctomycetaceae bacterium]|nr:LptF/LptG family permease [Planctomycetaceae bacterium]
MRLLQRYVLGELIRVFLLVVSVLTVLLVFLGAFTKASEDGLGPAEILQILPYLVPSLLPFTIPATMLLTVTVVYGRIAADHEVTAAKAAGISALSLLMPSFVMGVVLSIASLLLTDQVIPWAMTSIDNRVALMLENIFLDILRTHHIFVRRDPAITISVHDVEGNKLIKPTFHFTPRGGETIHIFADEATLHFDLHKRVVRVNLINLNGVVPDHESFRGQEDVWEFPLPDEPKKMKARSRSIRELRESLGGITFDLEGLRAGRDVETAFALATGDFDRLDKPDMLQYDADLIVKKEEVVTNHTEIHSRFALSASCFFFTLLGGPFSILQAKRQVLTSFIMCFLPILIAYYPIIFLMMNQSKNDVVNPAWAMWVANALIVPVAWYTLRRVLKH